MCEGASSGTYSLLKKWSWSKMQIQKFTNLEVGSFEKLIKAHLNNAGISSNLIFSLQKLHTATVLDL